MRKHALARVRTSLHEEARHRRIAPKHSIMQAPVLIVLCPVRRHQLGAAGEQHSHLCKIAGLYSLGESRILAPSTNAFNFGQLAKP